MMAVALFTRAAATLGMAALLATPLLPGISSAVPAQASAARLTICGGAQDTYPRNIRISSWTDWGNRIGHSDAGSSYGPVPLGLSINNTFSDSFTTTVSLSLEATVSILKIGAGADFSQTSTTSNTIIASVASMIVPKGHHQYVNAYPNYKRFSFDVWHRNNGYNCHDTMVGTATVNEPIGASFVVGNGVGN